MRTLFIILFFISSVCLAQSPKIKVVSLYGTYGFRCDQSLALYQLAANWIESQPGIRTSFKFVCEPWRGSKQLQGLYSTFIRLARNHRKRLPTKIVSIPMEYQNRLYTGGLAYIGLRAGFGWSFVTPTNQDGADRVRYALVVITHELGHTLGAQHDESYDSVMSTAVLYRMFQNPNLELRFTEKSIREIRKEVRNYRRKLNSRAAKVCNSLNVNFN